MFTEEVFLSFEGKSGNQTDIKTVYPVYRDVPDSAELWMFVSSTIYRIFFDHDAAEYKFDVDVSLKLPVDATIVHCDSFVPECRQKQGLGGSIIAVVYFTDDSSFICFYDALANELIETFQLEASGRHVFHALATLNDSPCEAFFVASVNGLKAFHVTEELEIVPMVDEDSAVLQALTLQQEVSCGCQTVGMSSPYILVLGYKTGDVSVLISPDSDLTSSKVSSFTMSALDGPVSDAYLYRSPHGSWNLIFSGSAGYVLHFDDIVAHGLEQRTEITIAPMVQDAVLSVARCRYNLVRLNSSAFSFEIDGWIQDSDKADIVLGTFGRKVLIYSRVSGTPSLQRYNREILPCAGFVWSRAVIDAPVSILCWDLSKTGSENIIVVTLKGVHIFRKQSEAVLTCVDSVLDALSV